MRLDIQLLRKGNEPIDGSKVTEEWICSLMETTRMVRLNELRRQEINLKICQWVALLISSIAIGVGAIPMSSIVHTIIYLAYWLGVSLIFKTYSTIAIAKVAPNTRIKMEVCFIKGTLNTLPNSCLVVQAVATEANRDRRVYPLDFDVAKNRKGYYAVCKCHSTLVATPLRDYETVEIID